MTARLVPVDARGTPDFVDELRAAWNAGNAVLPVDPRLPPTARQRLLRAMEPGRPVEAGDALVVPTSGTTGEPKGVVLTHEAVAASAHATSARLGVVPATDRWLACLPLAHVGGLSVVTRALVTGTPLEIHDGFEAGRVDVSPATLVSLVATALGRIDASRWRAIVLGGAAPPPRLPPNVVTTYGLTETGSGVVYDGVPLDGVEVRTDVAGQIHIRGPMLLRGYRDGTDPRDADGWLATGDLGSWDGERLTVHGRAGDLIVSGGENVWPEPVERALEAHPAIAEALVRGEPDPEWGERVVADVVLAPEAGRPTLSELRDWVGDRLPRYCAPRAVVAVERLDRTALGKLRRSPRSG